MRLRKAIFVSVTLSLCSLFTVLFVLAGSSAAASTQSQRTEAAPRGVDADGALMVGAWRRRYL